jgi:hypothetical protein
MHALSACSWSNEVSSALHADDASLQSAAPEDVILVGSSSSDGMSIAQLHRAAQLRTSCAYAEQTGVAVAWRYAIYI